MANIICCISGRITGESNTTEDSHGLCRACRRGIQKGEIKIDHNKRQDVLDAVFNQLKRGSKK